MFFQYIKLLQSGRDVLQILDKDGAVFLKTPVIILVVVVLRELRLLDLIVARSGRGCLILNGSGLAIVLVEEHVMVSLVRVVLPVVPILTTGMVFLVQFGAILTIMAHGMRVRIGKDFLNTVMLGVAPLLPINKISQLPLMGRISLALGGVWVLREYTILDLSIIHITTTTLDGLD